MAQIRAYLSFTDDCQEAMTFYQQCLGGELTIQHVAGSEMAANMPPELQNRVLHSSLVNGDLTLMASGLESNVTRSNSVSLLLQCGSREEIEQRFAALSAGGTVTYPLSESFWGSTFGHLTDRYGIPWMLDYTH